MDVKYVSTKPLEEFAINQKHKADDLISRQDAIGKIKDWMKFIGYSHSERNVMECTIQMLEELPSAQVPSYVAEIEAEYKKAVSQPWIHKPLAKALYEVWKKHDREDVSRPLAKEREEE